MLISKNIRLKKLSSLIILFLVIASVYFINAFFLYFSDNTNFNHNQSSFFIDSNDNLDSLAINLKPYLKSINNFIKVSKKKGYDNNIKPGKYLIKKGSSNNDIINNLRTNRLTVNVVFNNQERLEDLVLRISKQVMTDSLSLINSFLDPDFLSQKGFNSLNALSMYIPNTYDFYWDVSSEKFRDRMWKEYNYFWNEELEIKAKKINLSKIEVYILASIVQKESIKQIEKSRIAGVYLNRLKRNMKLQADPTVIYAIKKESNDFKKIIKRVLYKDLKIKSIYNTYYNRGLPPSPICMPDLSTIFAVLNPENHSFLYFVSDPENPGFHLFSENLIGHNRNKKKYINWLNKKKIYR
tara:strand:- start:1654 stop:2712 length:1059 start_codon:yes stop_codon:yes gene_type:complete